MLKKSGFTLIELLVSLLIGIIIILAAGTLFLSTLETYEKVEEISRKQESVVFATYVLAKNYRLKDKEEYKTDVKDNKCVILNEEDEIVVGGLHKEAGTGNDGCQYIIDENGSNKTTITIIFFGESKRVIFDIADRTSILE